MKKLIALLLSLILICCTLLACTGGDDGEETKETDNTKSTETQLYVADYLPDTTYDDASFRIITIDETSNMYTTFDCEADVSNKVLAAQYKRNRLIEDRYKIKFEQEFADTWEVLSSTLVDNATVGDDVYELNMLIQREAFTYATEGYVVRTGSLPYCDTTQPWYVQGINDELTVGNISFFAYTDECLNLFAQTDCILFNSRIVEDEGLTSPYDMVENNTWTMENFLSTARTATKDLDGDTYINDNDQLGIVGEGDVIYPSLWIGAGLKTIEKDEDDIPEFTADSNEKLIDLLGDLLDAFNDDGVIYDTTYHLGGTYKYTTATEHRGLARDIFMGGSSLYRVAMIGKLAELKEMVDDFGIVPCPKYDETQEEYCSRSCDGWLYVVPSTNTHLEMTSVILEALAVESKNYVYDAFYQESLQDRYTRDDGHASEMLDLISDTRTIDLGDTLWQSMSRNKIDSIFWSGENTFSSSLSSMRMMCNLTIELAIEDLQLSIE